MKIKEKKNSTEKMRPHKVADLHQCSTHKQKLRSRTRTVNDVHVLSLRAEVMLIALNKTLNG